MTGSLLLRAGRAARIYPRGGRLGPRAAHRAFGPVDLEVYAGEIVALVGRSGSGKSSLARCLAGLDPLSEGSRWVDGETSATVQLVFQDSPTALNPRWTAGELIGEPLCIAGRPERPELLAKRIAEVGLAANVVDRRPGQLSGGERRRVAIARALAVPGVRLLILDEPLGGLDAGNAGRIRDLLHSLAASRGLSLIYISHDLTGVPWLATRVMVMADGRIVEELRADHFQAEARHPESRALLEAVLPEPA